jgi:hypothetical protein
MPLLLLPLALQLLQDVLVDAGVICDKAVMLGDMTKRDTLYVVKCEEK